MHMYVRGNVENNVDGGRGLWGWRGTGEIEGPWNGPSPGSSLRALRNLQVNREDISE